MAFSWGTYWSAQTYQLGRAYLMAKRLDFGLHLTGIPASYDGALPLASFEPAVMAQLFHFAENRMESGEIWLREPPGTGWRERMD